MNLRAIIFTWGLFLGLFMGSGCPPVPPDLEPHKEPIIMEPASGEEPSVPEDGSTPEPSTREARLREPAPDAAPQEPPPEPEPTGPEPQPREPGRDGDASDEAGVDGEPLPEPDGQPEPDLPPPPSPTILAALELQKTKLIVYPYSIDPTGAFKAGTPLQLASDDYTFKGKAVATLHKDRFYLVKFDDKNKSYTLEKRRLFGGASVETYGLKNRRPTALFAREDYLYIGGIEGTKTRVDTLDMGQQPAVYTKRYTAMQSFRQEIDDFVLTGNTLIAIDDVVIPKYGFVFDVDARGHYLKHRFTSWLPIVVDGTYPEATVQGKFVYLRSDFYNGHGLGGGRALLRLEITSNLVRERVTLAEYKPESSPSDPKTDLLGGKVYTPWQGMEILGDKLLIGAGTRGIMTFDAMFKTKDRSILFDPGGECTDLMKLGDAVYALVKDAKGSTSLVVLQWDGSQKALKVVKRHPLSGAPTRFPR